MSELGSEPAVVEDKPPRIQAIWILPLLVLVAGIYVVVQTYLDQGPTITIQFETAAGLQAGKTQLKALNVEIGLVEDVSLAEDLSHVTITVKLNPGTRALLREDTQIWVERPRIGAGGISGLGTLLSGAYIELSPGTGATGKRTFIGLEQVPATAPGVPGVRVALYSDRANSVSPGDPVLYRGFKVGKVESANFDLETSQMLYGVFIDAPYNQLVTNGTRFWNASGLNLEADASGIRLQVGSLTSLIAGGVSFDVPDIAEAGETVDDGASFRLYPDQRSSETNPYRFGRLLVAEFEQSLRGLAPGAPVEYRGIRVGTVERIIQDDLGDMRGKGAPIPVILRAEPGRFGLGDTEAALLEFDEMMALSVSNGLRATVQTGNLLSGSLYVSLEHFPDAEPALIGEYRGYPTLPTVSGGLQRLERQLATLLDKINALPLDKTVDELNATITQARTMLASVDNIVNDEATKALPSRLEATLVEFEHAAASFAEGSQLYGGANETLAELSQTLASVRALAQKLEDQPNTLIFSTPQNPDPEPGKRSP